MFFKFMRDCEREESYNLDLLFREDAYDIFGDVSLNLECLFGDIDDTDTDFENIPPNIDEIDFRDSDDSDYEDFEIKIEKKLNWKENMRYISLDDLSYDDDDCEISSCSKSEPESLETNDADPLFCVCCNKHFKNKSATISHRKSKQHIINKNIYD